MKMEKLPQLRVLRYTGAGDIFETENCFTVQKHIRKTKRTGGALRVYKGGKENQRRWKKKKETTYERRRRVSHFCIEC